MDLKHQASCIDQSIIDQAPSTNTKHQAKQETSNINHQELSINHQEPSIKHETTKLQLCLPLPPTPDRLSPSRKQTAPRKPNRINLLASSYLWWACNAEPEKVKLIICMNLTCKGSMVQTVSLDTQTSSVLPCLALQTANPGDWPPGGFWRLAARSVILFSFTLWGTASLGRNHFPPSFSRNPENLRLYNVDRLHEDYPSMLPPLQLFHILICRSSRFHKDVMSSRSSRST